MNSKRVITLPLLAAVPLLLSVAPLRGCQELVPKNTSSLLIPRFTHAEVVGFVAGLGTTFAAVPDLIALLRRRRKAVQPPRMAVIMGAFQILWVYYGLLIASRPVIAWNLIAILVNFFSLAAYISLRRQESKT